MRFCHQSSLYGFLKDRKKDFKARYKEGLIFLVEEQIAQKLSDVAIFLGYQSFILPDFRVVFGEDLRSYQEELLEIFNVLRQFYSSKEPKILFSPVHTLLHKMPTLEALEGIEMHFGESINLQDFKERMLCFGYEFVDMVEVSKEISVRGDIIDIFLPDFENPIRISLFGDEIESIREFDVSTQLCLKEEKESLKIFPAFFNLDSSAYEILLETLQKNLKEEINDERGSLIASYGLWYLQDNFSQNLLLKYPCMLVPNVQILIEEILSFKDQDKELLKKVLSFEVLKSAVEYEDFEINFKNLPTFLSLHHDKKITILSKTESQVRQAGISFNDPYEFCIGCDCGVWILSHKEVILSLNVAIKTKRKTHNTLLIDELKAGDYVVHVDYGVAIFGGIIQANIFGATRDFIELKYLGEDKLLLPVENLDRVDRYIADGQIPILDKLGKGSFARLKERVKEKLLVIANAIIALAAKRELLDGAIIDTKKEEILLFQSQSGFVYTQSQKQAIGEIFKDLSSGRVMDRLLSGDVGFGKTEVAMNAIFACFLSGYQSILIAPTTLLSYQHFNSLQKRFSSFGMRLARLDRYVGAKEKKEILRGLKEGEIHVVVGTHSLLNVEFKNLALVIVDEEHKFGVKQKEKIKDLSVNTHLLSMSATPIPRTLNMALSQVKGLSEL
ncbi:MAG: DEAD/DEAH box helicase, partial [Helicobacter sp.]|nr:DEAD/DEAH box helicase [Helicobacter sp.]